jgi:amino acid adenylation domain-containing protein
VSFDEELVPVPHQIARQASRTPHALALADEARAITYGELETRSNVLAAQLGSFRLGGDAVVGVCVKRSVAAIIGALAVMKAGAAYLPLDPAQPMLRRRSALAVARAEVVLISDDAGAWDDIDGVIAVRLDGDGRFDGASQAAGALVERRDSDLAYVISTSGSSGEPKAVEIAHGALANLCAWHRAAFAIVPADRASHIAAIGFDAAVWEVWPYLCAGASVHIAPNTVARDPRALADWLLANAISVAFAVTPMAERLLDFDYPADTALRVLLTGADTLHRRPPPNLPFALYNNYGPTEATVVTTSCRVEAGSTGDARPSIGSPIENVTVFLLDERGQLQTGIAQGEIAIAGANLARGYRGRPDLTADAFVWIEDAHGIPTRVYRSGDRGQRTADGNIHFLGRIDDQVKIRGFRVEPGEVETLINAYADVVTSAVIAQERAPGDTCLIAYIVPTPRTDLGPGALRARLAQYLPEHLIPAAFVQLPALPLTPNGKVDRKDLQRRDIVATIGEAAGLTPRTTTEARVAQIVATLLGREHVGVEDDFFMLGGHSLLGTQVIARLRDAFGVTIGLRFLFESPTIAALAAEIERQVLARLDAVGDAARSERATAPIPRRRA